MSPSEDAVGDGHLFGQVMGDSGSGSSETLTSSHNYTSRIEALQVFIFRDFFVV